MPVALPTTVAMSRARLVQNRMPASVDAASRIAMLVRASLQHVNASRRERRRHVVIIVVIAEDREDAMRRGQRRERFSGRHHERAVAPGDVIAAEHDEVGLGGHQQSHAAIDVVGGYPLAAMDVGEESDPKSRQRRAGGRRPAGSLRVRSSVMPLVEKAVRAGAGQRGGAVPTSVLSDRAPRDRHRTDIVNRIRAMAECFSTN